MEYLQYYKATTFNFFKYKVLNLIINGIPSIPMEDRIERNSFSSFKPYYKWNTFNTKRFENLKERWQEF